MSKITKVFKISWGKKLGVDFLNTTKLSKYINPQCYYEDLEIYDISSGETSAPKVFDGQYWYKNSDKDDIIIRVIGESAFFGDVFFMKTEELSLMDLKGPILKEEREIIK